MNANKQLGVVGGGPSCLFILKKLIDDGVTDVAVIIFEKSGQLGAGMPYSNAGANVEHITNVSGNEIPEMVTSVADWVATLPKNVLEKYKLDPENFNDYKVLPRLLFGLYLQHQFKLLLKKAKKIKLEVKVCLNTPVIDITDNQELKQITVTTSKGNEYIFDKVVICSGHYWPKTQEDITPGFFDSPYPPKKIRVKLNYPVAIKGASLTAIDAIRTLAKKNGRFQNNNGKLVYQLSKASEGLKLIMHSRSGLLPAVRFHLEDTHLGKTTLLSNEEIEENRKQNEGFLSLDYIFERNFKDGFKARHKSFYNAIKTMQMEEFVDYMMSLRENADPFDLLIAESKEAEESIKKRESVYWKEMLAVLSFAMNYPAKYFSAEDMLRLQKTLMPLIAIVIAFIPQDSVEEMLALHNAGVLNVIAVGEDSYVEPAEQQGAIYHYTDNEGKHWHTYYKTFIDCVGQPHLNYKDIPYKSLLENKTVSSALIRFRDQEIGKKAMNENSNVTIFNNCYYLKTSGIAVNDCFQVMDMYGAYNERVYMMAVPYIGGYNPDYSGLDFCEEASKRIVHSLLQTV